MNKKEVSEIKKQLSPVNCAITRICGRYVNDEKEIVSTSKKAFLSLPEEEMFKYYDILSKTLSGKLGKNLLNLSYETKEKIPEQDMLLRLRDSKLTNDNLLEEFYGSVIDIFDYTGNYYIILIHSCYDIPGGDEVFEYIQCAVCPVSLSKPGLSYRDNAVKERIRDWIVEMPVYGFLYPSFTDRTANIHEVLMYTKKASEVQFAEFLGTVPPITADEQQEKFNTAVPEGATLENLIHIHSDINSMAEEDGVIDDAALKKLFASENLIPAKLDSSILASNIGGPVKIKLHDTTITTESSDIRTEVINGIRYVLVPAAGGVEINGVVVGE